MSQIKEGSQACSKVIKLSIPKELSLTGHNSDFYKINSK